ncbi:hypothetical protein LX77_01613 [Gelidibacter algens]|uniref:Uncharacterized protein n=1 Tax=Gelidibacter algens TaxID=49280 RepID=A0A1A7R241_9FLAO|nr:hypothetical protein [Gelidibacter algens]OBX25896.1 hypothetical protein A9996_07160 [Gelidibacter algens]RAJ25310.1 hypothetical protein LX77_01613 [Gelidibacter algens]
MKLDSLEVDSSFLKRVFLGIILAITSLNLSFGQELQDGQKRWSSETRLSLDDFKIKVSEANNEVAFSQFMITHAIGGFDFMKKNMNQKVGNIFLGNASYIDTSRVENIQEQLDFQQMQFDLAEIQARNFRKRVLKNKSQLTKGFDIINKINNEIMSELSEMRLTLMRDTDTGRNKQQVAEWKEKIKIDLKVLHDFRFENKEKIKLTE